MTLRLSEEETELLRKQAEREHRSMQEVARLAILDRIERDSRSERIRAMGQAVMERDAELMDRLAK